MHQLCPFLQQPTSHEVVNLNLDLLLIVLFMLLVYLIYLICDVTSQIMHSVVHLPIGSIAFHPNGKHLVASRCRQLTLWDIESTEPSQPINTKFTEHESERIRGVLFDPYGRYLVTAIRRVTPAPAPKLPDPEVKVEVWTPKRPKSGRYSKLNPVKDALNKLIYAGQKRSHFTANSNRNSTGLYHLYFTTFTFHQIVF